MAIDFEKFTNDLARYFGDPNQNFGASQGDATRGRDDAAEFITNLYVTNILQGLDGVYGNVVVGFQKPTLKTALLTAFNIGFRANSNIHFSNTISGGLVGFWAGGTLGFLVPPPSSIQIVSNVVVFPGSPQVLRTRNTTSHSEFAKELVQMFRRHLITLTGITTSLVPQPTGPPIPITFPWSSYR